MVEKRKYENKRVLVHEYLLMNNKRKISKIRNSVDLNNLLYLSIVMSK